MNRPIDFDAIMANPNAYGLPTFEQFRQNPDQYRLKSTFQLDSADNGSTTLNRLVKKQVYEFEGYECNNIEEVEKIALSEGVDLKDLVMKPELEKDTAGKLIVRVRFTTRQRLALAQKLGVPSESV